MRRPAPATARGDARRWVVLAWTVLAATLLVTSVTRPVARTGLGSTLSLHQLFDLVLSGNLPVAVPRWIGLSGYLPAFAGAVLLIAEAATGRLRTGLRIVGLGVATASVTAIVTLGPWEAPGTLGTGAWLALAGVLSGWAGVGVGAAARLAHRDEPMVAHEPTVPEHPGNGTDDARSAAAPNQGEPHVLSPMRY